MDLDLGLAWRARGRDRRPPIGEPGPVGRIGGWTGAKAALEGVFVHHSSAPSTPSRPRSVRRAWEAWFRAALDVMLMTCATSSKDKSAW